MLQGVRRWLEPIWRLVGKLSEGKKYSHTARVSKRKSESINQSPWTFTLTVFPKRWAPPADFPLNASEVSVWTKTGGGEVPWSGDLLGLPEGRSRTFRIPPHSSSIYTKSRAPFLQYFTPIPLENSPERSTPFRVRPINCSHSTSSPPKKRLSRLKVVLQKKKKTFSRSLHPRPFLQPWQVIISPINPAFFIPRAEKSSTEGETQCNLITVSLGEVSTWVRGEKWKVEIVAQYKAVVQVSPEET